MENDHNAPQSDDKNKSARRRVWHYGIEFNGWRYFSLELREFRGLTVEIWINPANLDVIRICLPDCGGFITVPRVS
jgi:hypothetical protein